MLLAIGALVIAAMIGAPLLCAVMSNARLR